MIRVELAITLVMVCLPGLWAQKRKQAKEQLPDYNYVELFDTKKLIDRSCESIWPKAVLEISNLEELVTITGADKQGGLLFFGPKKSIVMRERYGGKWIPEAYKNFIAVTKPPRPFDAQALRISSGKIILIPTGEKQCLCRIEINYDTYTHAYTSRRVLAWLSVESSGKLENSILGKLASE